MLYSFAFNTLQTFFSLKNKLLANQQNLLKDFTIFFGISKTNKNEAYLFTKIVSQWINSQKNPSKFAADTIAGNNC